MRLLLKVGIVLEAACVDEGVKKNGSVLSAMSLQWGLQAAQSCSPSCVV